MIAARWLFNAHVFEPTNCTNLTHECRFKYCMKHQYLSSQLVRSHSRRQLAVVHFQHAQAGAHLLAERVYVCPVQQFKRSISMSN